MRLKILVLPIFIIIELILVIVYIKPNVDIITTKQSEITVQQEALSRVDSVASNIGLINQSLTENAPMVDFIERYYPKSSDEERVVDMFNYLSQLAGVIVTGVEITASEGGVPVGPAETPAADGMGELGTMSEGVLDLSESYQVSVSVLGTYQNLKNFFNRVRSTDRLHVTQEFSVSTRETSTSPEELEKDQAEGIQSDFLTGEIVADFFYVKEKRAGDPLSIGLFQKASFDFSGAETLKALVTNPLPALSVNGAGKPNPFQ